LVVFPYSLENPMNRHLLLSLLLLGVAVLPEPSAAAPKNGMPLVCGVNALTARERGRRETLVEDLMPEAQIEETTDGYQFTWTTDPQAYNKVVEFVGLERRCCPFLDFEMRVSGPNSPVVLVLHGDDDTKEFVKDSGLLQGKP